MTGKFDFSKYLVNLASRRLGAKVLEVSDDFFAEAKRMLQDSEPTFKPELFDEHGKWMDGWESRRRREPGHDYALVQLGTRGIVHGMDIDTRHFTGNYPPPPKHRWKGWIAVLLQTRFPEIGKNCFQSQNLALIANICSPLKTAAH